VLWGGRITVSVMAPGRRRLTIAQRVTGASWTVTPLELRDGRATATLGPLDADLTLVAGDGRAASDTVRVRVVDRPFVGDVALRAEFPAYLRRPPEPVAAGEVVRVPRGTVLSIDGRASAALASIALTRGADTLRLRANGHRFSGRLSAAADAGGHWAWSARGEADAIADLPAPLELEVIPDSVPRVEILSPTRDSVVTPGDRVRLTIVAADDHGLAMVMLRTRRVTASGTALPEVAQGVAQAAGPEWSGTRELDLATRQLEPGDALHVIAAATDESPWHQTGESRELVLRIPTLSEQRALARGTADSAVTRAAAVASAERQLQQRTAEAARSRGPRGQETASGAQQQAQARTGESRMAYEAAEQAKALARQQQALSDQVRSLQSQAKALEQQMRQAGALDSGLAARLQEAQQLLAQALTPELAAQLKQLQDAAQQLKADDTRRTLGDLAAQQQRMREQLDRAVEMLRRAALEGSMQTLRDEAKEIAARERALVDSSARRDSVPNGAARALADRSTDLTKGIDELTKRLDQAQADAAARRLPQARRQTAASADAMRRASERPQGKEGRQAAEDAAQKMADAAEQLAQARQEQIDAWKEELTAELDQAVQELQQLARQESELSQDAQQQQGDAAGMRGQQSTLQQGVDRTGDRLQKAGRKSSLLSQRSQRDVSDARRKVQQATQESARASGQQTAGAMREAADALNQAAASLARDRDRANGAQSASGFAEMLEQMRQMAKEQGSLNAQAQGMPIGPNGQLGESGMAGARALGQLQRGLAQRLDQLAEGDESGRASAMAKEARQIAQALDRGAVDQSLLDRQQRLFRRLLDAGTTLEQDERDDRGKRESRAATGAEAFTPGGPANGRAASRYREPTWSELRGLTADERRLVLDYFRRLNASP
jgi:hypothetical protein